MKLAGWARLFLLALALILLNGTTTWVLNSNLNRGVYGYEGDITETPGIGTILGTILAFPILLIVSFLPFANFIKRGCEQSTRRGMVIGVLLLTFYAILGFLSVRGLIYWSDRFHYLIFLIYLLLVLSLARCYWNDTHRLFGSGFKKWFGAYLALLVIFASALLLAGERFYLHHTHTPSPDEITESFAQSNLRGYPIEQLVAADGAIYIGSSYGRVLRSDDNGTRWLPASHGLDDASIKSLAVAPNGSIYAGTSKKGVFMSVDRGTRWTSVGYGLPDAQVLAMAITSRGTILAETDRGLFLNDGHDNDWKSANIDPKEGKTRSLILGKGDVAYALAGDRVYKSVDEGLHWFLASQTLEDSFPRFLAVAPDGVLYAVTGKFGLFRSEDQGENWTNVSQQPGKFMIRRFVAASSGVLYAVDESDEVFVSRDGGKNWRTVNRDKRDKREHYITALAMARDGSVYLGLGAGELYALPRE